MYLVGQHTSFSLSEWERYSCFPTSWNLSPSSPVLQAGNYCLIFVVSWLLGTKKARSEELQGFGVFLLSWIFGWLVLFCLGCCSWVIGVNFKWVSLFSFFSFWKMASFQSSKVFLHFLVQVKFKVTQSES